MNAENQSSATPPVSEPSIAEGSIWGRLPKPGQTLRGLRNTALRELIRKKLVGSVSVAVEGKSRGVRMIHLPGLDEYLAEQYRLQNDAPDAEKEIMEMLETVLDEDTTGGIVTLPAYRMAEILLGHPATRQRAVALLVGDRAMERKLYLLAALYPKRVWPEQQGKATYWNIVLE